MNALTIVRIAASVLTGVMAVVIGWAMATGSIGEEGSVLLDLPWGVVSLVDVYVGVALIFGWALLRERSPLVALAWLPVFVILGHGGTALYVAVSAFRADSIDELLMGARANS